MYNDNDINLLYIDFHLLFRSTPLNPECLLDLHQPALRLGVGGIASVMIRLSVSVNPGIAGLNPASLISGGGGGSGCGFYLYNLVTISTR